MTAVREHRYGALNRPIGFSTAPIDGLLRVDPPPLTEEAGLSVSRHGVAIYSRALSEQEIRSYELVPLMDADTRQAAIHAIAAYPEFRDYRDVLLAYFQDPLDRRIVEQIIAHLLEQAYPCGDYPGELGRFAADVMTIVSDADPAGGSSQP